MEITIVPIKKMKRIAKVDENVKNGSLTVAMANVSFQLGNAMEITVRRNFYSIPNYTLGKKI